MSAEPTRRTILGAAAITAVSAPLLVACSGRKVAPETTSGTVIAPLDAVPDGDTVVVMTAAGSPVVLSRDGDSVTAYSGICTHQGCSVRKETGYLLCPCHNSKFDWDGSVISGLAKDPLPPIAVEVVNGDIVAAG